MNPENNSKPRGSWLRRIAIALAVLVIAVLFWPPQWWPSLIETPMSSWQFLLAVGPAIPVHIDTDGNRIRPTVFETEPGFVENVEAELAQRNARLPEWHYHADRSGRLHMTRFDAAIFAGWLPGIHWEQPPEDIDPFAEGPVPWPTRKEVLYFNRDGSVAFAMAFEEEAPQPVGLAPPFREGLAPVPTRWREPGDDAFAMVRGGDGDSWVRAMEATHFGFVSADGEWAIPPQFDDARPFHQGLAAVSKDGLWGYIDSSGAFVIEPRWREANSFSEGLAAVHEEGAGWGYITPDGEWAIEPRFASASAFSEGLAVVAEGAVAEDSWSTPRVYGYINPEGAWVLEPRYKAAEPFSSGLAAVHAGPNQGFEHATGYINRDGEVVIEGPFFSASPFLDGEAFVAKRVTPARWLLAMFRYRVLNRPNWEL